MKPADAIAAMKATHLETGRSGLWRVRRVADPPFDPQRVEQETGPLTILGRTSIATLHAGPYAEVVMEDSTYELKRHLQFVLRAHGRVLVTGLGLGCVARGLMANPAVESIDVVERDPDVLRLVEHQMETHARGARRLFILRSDALEFVRSATKRGERSWDCAWHDLWSDEDKGEPHLAITHQLLLIALRGKVKMQGAWAFPRYLRRAVGELIGRQVL